MFCQNIMKSIHKTRSDANVLRNLSLAVFLPIYIDGYSSVYAISFYSGRMHYRF